MKAYRELVKRVLDFGEVRDDRTGVGTISLFGEMVRFDLRSGFPATTSKRLAFKQVAGELACFLKGSRNLTQFHELGVKIWDANGTAAYWSPEVPGDLGRIYGVQWREFYGKDAGPVDQLEELIAGLAANPESRRHIVTAWQPAELSAMCLPPCHILFQCFVSQNRAYLDLRVDMRSVDLFLGMPFDVASYGLLMHLICQTLGNGIKPRWLTFQLGDTHIYKNHVQQCFEMLGRDLRTPPTLVLAPEATVFNFHPSMAELANYDPHPTIKGDMAV